MTGKFFYVAFAFILIVAGLLRFPRLEQRPLHNDEAVNTVKFNDLWSTARFNYDPNEYHGPSLIYFTLPSTYLSGAGNFAQTTEWTYRVVPVCFGLATIALTLLVRKGLGDATTLFSAAFIAVSPAFVFYNRYYIHETPLVFFSFAAITCGWRWATGGRLVWALCTGAAVGLMYATKETWILPLAAAFGACMTLYLIRKWRREPPAFRIRPTYAFISVVVAALVSITFFTGFFSNPNAIVDAILAYKVYLHRANTSQHNHPFLYYLQILFYSGYTPGRAFTSWSKFGLSNLSILWSEAIILILAGNGVLFSFFTRNPLIKFLAFYTLLLTLIYSIIPYKTPWCLLGFLHGMTLLAGYASAVIVSIPARIKARRLAVRSKRLQAENALDATDRSGARTSPANHAPVLATILTVILLLPIGHLAMQSYAMNIAWQPTTITGQQAAPRRHPYVYAHTSADLLNVVTRINDLAPLTANGQPSVKILTADCWPLPFYLRRYTQVGYYATLPSDAAANLDADLVIMTPETEPQITPRLTREYHYEFVALRPQVHLYVAINQDLWNRFIAARQ